MPPSVVSCSCAAHWSKVSGKPNTPSSSRTVSYCKKWKSLSISLVIRDILIDDDELFDFYDQRVGEEAVSGRHFDTWWKKTSQKTPELLNFEKSMLFRGDASHVTDLDYPNFWHQNGIKLKLSYQFRRATTTMV